MKNTKSKHPTPNKVTGANAGGHVGCQFGRTGPPASLSSHVGPSKIVKTLMAIALILWCVCFSGRSQQTNVQSMFSPGLKDFFASHAGALPMLTNILHEAFSKRAIQLYYFYSADNSVAIASHYYPSDSAVGIVLRENMEPIDQFIGFVFEAINSEGQPSFEKIIKEAEQGKLSKRDFTTETLKQEFKAVVRTRALLQRLKLEAKEIAESREYKHFEECPDSFEDFLAYTKKISGKERDVFEEYDKQYDLLRNRCD